MSALAKSLIVVAALVLTGCGGGASDPVPNPPPDTEPPPDPDPPDPPDPVVPPVGTVENPFSARGITATRAPDPLLPAEGPSATASGIDVVFADNDLFLFTVQEGYGASTPFLCNLAPEQLNCSATVRDELIASSSGPALEGEFSAAVVLSVTFNRGDGPYTQITPLYFETSQTTAADVVLPAGTVVYSGDTVGQGRIGATSGPVAGTFTLTSDFGSNTVDGTFIGLLPGQVRVGGSWTGATIDPGTTGFQSDDGTTFMLQSTAANGIVDGGFFGPGAEETAGALWLESANGTNTVSLIFLGTQPPPATP